MNKTRTVYYIDVSSMSSREAYNLFTTLKLCLTNKVKCPRLLESVCDRIEECPYGETADSPV